jgi:NAD(P)-dependent dehydrogenase (short-subunit alcohol dehydrogenase family)
MAKWDETDIGDLAGRVAIVTGANSGIGWEAARMLAQHGAAVVMACRNADKAARAHERLLATHPAGAVSVAPLDLSSLASVRHFAESFGRDHDRLDLLINNAGVMATPKSTTADGFELQLGTNHLGHFALTSQLIEIVTATAGARVVNVSSLAHTMGRIALDDLHGERNYSPWGAYNQSKLANLLFTMELQRRLVASGASTLATAAHPGLAATELQSGVGGIAGALRPVLSPMWRVVAQSARMGALPTVRAAVGRDVNANDYFGPGGIGEYRGHPERARRSARAHDAVTAALLWEASCEMTGEKFLSLD